MRAVALLLLLGIVVVAATVGTRLEDGVATSLPTVGDLSMFLYSPQHPVSDIMIEVNAVGAELYVSCEGDATPTASNSTWTSTRRVVVKRADPRKCRTFVIAVVSLTSIPFSAKETIEATSFAQVKPGLFCTHNMAKLSASDPVVIPLTDGVPYSIVAQVSGDWRFFSFKTARGNAVTVDVQPTSGDPDLFIDCGVYPSFSQYRWASQAFGADTIRIEASDPYACSPTAYMIGVVGFTTTSFYVTASTDAAHIQLVDGIPQTGSVGYQKKSYFQISQGIDASDVYIQAIPYSGNPIMWISCSPFPSSTNYRWFADSWNTTMSVLIPMGTGCSNKEYYIAVEGIYGSAVFEIVAQLRRDTTITLLSEGLPFIQVSGLHQWLYFKLGASAFNDTQFSLTTFNGGVQLYVGCTGAPTQASAIWQLTQSNGVITIPYADSRSCSKTSGRTWYLGVLGTAEFNFFELVGTSTAYDTVVIAGFPVTGNVARESYNYYQFRTTELADVNIKLHLQDFASVGPHGSNNMSTQARGQASLYVSTYTHPTQFNYQFTGETIRLLRWPAGNFFIAVRGLTASTTDYAVTCTTDSSPIYMAPRLAFLVNSTVANEYNYFQTLLPKSLTEGLNITFKFSSSSGNAYIYMSCDREHPPTPTQYLWAAYPSPGLRTFAVLKTAPELRRCGQPTDVITINAVSTAAVRFTVQVQNLL